MLAEIDVLLGLALEAKETNNNATAIIEKANWLNRDVTPALRKSIIMPILNAADPNVVLDNKCNEYFARQRIRNGVMH